MCDNGVSSGFCECVRVLDRGEDGVGVEFYADWLVGCAGGASCLKCVRYWCVLCVGVGAGVDGV